MKPYLSFMLRSVALAFLLWSCHHEDDDAVESHEQGNLTFAFVDEQANSGGRTLTDGPLRVSYKLRKADGLVLSDELDLFSFNGGFVTHELTLSVGHYELQEFFILDAGNHVVFAAPIDDSEKARFVTEPLPIPFDVTPQETTQVVPEVLAVDESVSPEAFGYAIFSFKVVETIQVAFSSFISSPGIDPELTTAHVKIEGLENNTDQANALWSYETDLEPAAKIIRLRKAAFYRITATKPTFDTWEKTLVLSNASEVEILFERILVDIYMAGSDHDRAVYWKNGVKVAVSDRNSLAEDIVVSGNDVYIGGFEFGSASAMYWKNGTKVNLGIRGRVDGIAVDGNDVYAAGEVDEPVGAGGASRSVPAYWKNGVLTKLQIPDGYTSGEVSAITVDGADVYAVGVVLALGGQHYPAMLWKNGQPTELPAPVAGGFDYTTSEARQIEVANGHVYISGVSRSHHSPSDFLTQAVMWIDGQRTILGAPGVSSEAIGLDVVNEDVYVVGTQQLVPGGGNTGVYWKNGEPVTVDPHDVNLKGIHVVEDNVYITGHDLAVPAALQAVADYWVNGRKIEVGDRTATSFVTSSWAIPRP